LKRIDGKYTLKLSPAFHDFGKIPALRRRLRISPGIEKPEGNAASPLHCSSQAVLPHRNLLPAPACATCPRFRKPRKPICLMGRPTWFDLTTGLDNARQRAMF
jgi:hypothetical protein